MNAEIRLWKRCLDGDPAALERLYQTYFRPVFSYVFFRTLNRFNTEDIVSEVFFKVFKHLSDFDPKRGRLIAWIFGIARQEVANFFRQHNGQQTVNDCWDFPAGNNPEKEAINQESLQRLQIALAGLPPAKREMLIMRLWMEMPFKQIAAVFATTPDCCKMTFYRALETLRRELYASSGMLGLILIKLLI